jgi:hypothetical protein
MSDDPKADDPSADATKGNAPKADVQQPRAPSARPRRNALGEERPEFLLQYPDDPELALLMQAFEAGDFATVRKQAPELIRRATDPAVRRAAHELRERIDPDPLLIVLLVFACSLFVFLVVWIYTR